MPVMALDTTTRLPSAAIVSDDRVIASSTGTSTRSHAEQLPNLLLDLLTVAGITLDAIDVFAVASGPGAFTGLRIGLATIQGLALVTGRRVVPVSALEALAHAASLDAAPGTIVGAWMDAHRRDVFAALYRTESVAAYTGGRLVELDAPFVELPDAVLDRWQATLPATLIGDGAVAHAASAGYGGTVMAPPPLAPIIGRLAVDRARRGETVDPAGVQPAYVRRPDAELARDALARDAGARERR